MMMTTDDYDDDENNDNGFICGYMITSVNTSSKNIRTNISTLIIYLDTNISSYVARLVLKAEKLIVNGIFG